ncbi:Heat shock protein HtpX [Brevundimonas diminuta 3F5N]|uniref:Heat shock protein HtpX n=1 Tax=Brevundimonas diminuta 3F5N TaxID=1255603 RepID=A0A1R4FUC0_BREDI|nr:M48 family metallopeptidase [Brevundimonas diminuta]SJM59433.1 Heat shock protein HtpX [Brevundimonas diminuta 3F5N]
MAVFGQAVGLKTHIWRNNTRSAILLAGFPVLLVGILFGIQVLMMGFGLLPNSGGDLGQDLALAASMLGWTVPFAAIAAAIWFVIAYFGNQMMIDVMTGARKVERRSEPDLYNLLENLAISRGMKTPALRIIESPSLNAYASGLHEGNYSVTVTRGLMQTLNRDEMECVLAHELTHVINKDVRTMVIASIFAGIISVVAELVFRSLFYVRGGRGGNNKNAMPLILIGLAIGVIGFGLAAVIRMTLSRTREYVADAGAVELTKNPDAMISALRKVSGQSKLEAPDELRGMFLDNTAEKAGFSGLFATHPPISKRIAALVQFAGGRDDGPWGGAPQAAGTAVPTT